MKKNCYLACKLLLLFLTSCSVISSRHQNTSPLVLTLEIAQREVNSIDELQLQVHLLNCANSSILVHRRLYDLPFSMPPSSAELLILISDSSGNLIYNAHYFPNYHLPGDDTLNVLKSGEWITKKITNLNIKFDENMFRKGEKYTIVAIYQNSIDVTKTIDGVKVSSWVGTVRSNEEAFVIFP